MKVLEEQREKNNRTHKISFRLNTREYDRVLKLAAISNSSLSDFVRLASLKANVVAKMTAEERKYSRMLVGIATNLNQLAHKANSQVDFLTIAIELQNTRRAIDSIINRLNKNDL